MTFSPVGLAARALRAGPLRGAFAALLSALLLAACGSGATPTPNPPPSETISVSPPSATAAVGGTVVAFTATVKNGANSGFDWQVNGVSGGSPTYGTISGAGLYTSPAVMPTDAALTITAVSSTDATESGSAGLTLMPAGAAVTVTLTPPSATVAIGGSQIFLATVVNTANTAVTWQVNGVTGGDATVGTVSTAGLYQAPATVPAQPTVALTAISVADPNASAVADITVASAAPSPPSISGTPPTTGTAGIAYSFVPTASSPRGGALTFSITNPPSWASFSTTTGALTGTPAAANVGASANIMISVNDGTASASLPAFTITVNAAAAPPTIGGTPATTVKANAAYSFTPTASSPRGGTLTFSITNMPSWAAFSTTTGALTGTPTTANIGTFANIGISVNDGTLSASLPTFTITVSAGTTGSATLSWSAPTTRTDGTVLSNLAGYNLYYGMSQGSYPNKVQVAGTGLLTFVIPNLPSGTYYFVATAYDTNGVESDQTNSVSKTIP